VAPQIVTCSTSIAAMLEEARAAESRRDFVSAQGRTPPIPDPDS
jgi:hypothetical protein